jgi:solute carrier family 25 S-adenosylmethionine transporter 26
LSEGQSGGAAGVAVDTMLFPLDTIKTRLQSQEGFRASGGFRSIYAGLGSSVVGSLPSAALFFFVYEGIKKTLPWSHHPASVMLAATAGEVAACLVRVPVEVVKQRTQATGHSSYINFRKTIASEGIRGLYRGYTTTVFREIPFAFIQFPIWEVIKTKIATYNGRKSCTPSEATVSGAIAGGIAAFLTTPLDVSKTRVMLAEKGSSLSSGSVFFALRTIFLQKGIRGLFAGVLPRVTWISVGGAIFLGGYEKTAQTLETHFPHL